LISKIKGIAFSFSLGLVADNGITISDEENETLFVEFELKEKNSLILFYYQTN